MVFRSAHFFGVEDLVELFCCEEAKLYASFFERDVILVSFLCGLCCIFVTDIGIERGYEHERIVEIVVHLFAICCDSDSALKVERNDRLCKKL